MIDGSLIVENNPFTIDSFGDLTQFMTTSQDKTGIGNNVGIDDIAIIPEPTVATLIALGGTGLLAAKRTFK